MVITMLSNATDFHGITGTHTTYSQSHDNLPTSWQRNVLKDLEWRTPRSPRSPEVLEVNVAEENSRGLPPPSLNRGQLESHPKRQTTGRRQTFQALAHPKRETSQVKTRKISSTHRACPLGNQKALKLLSR